MNNSNPLMNLNALGYNSDLEEYRKNKNLEEFDVGRVISEHKERYLIKSDIAEFDAEIVGNLRYSAKKREDFPAVGDWVSFQSYDSEKAIIHYVFPRKNCLERQASGKHGEKQIIASNIDYALIVQSANRDFNLNRLERYLTLCNASHIKSAVILSKTDLINMDEKEILIKLIKQRREDIQVIAISNLNMEGLKELEDFILPAKTYCLLGSSGVGKSSLINNLTQSDVMETKTISSSTNKGKHTTSHRELFILPHGGIIIDNPGMREVGITDSESAVQETFDKILQFASNCRFKNCTHVHEAGCAVIEAMHEGIVDQAAYTNYLKLQKEQEHFESTRLEKKQKEKSFGKMIKQAKKDLGRNKL